VFFFAVRSCRVFLLTSLAQLLRIILTGRRLVEELGAGRSRVEVTAEHARDSPMNYESRNPNYSRAFATIISNAFKTNPAAALAPALEVHLWKDAAFQPTSEKVAADFAAVECDYTDYAAAAAVVLTTPVNLNPDSVGAVANTLFTITNPVVTANQVFGYWLETGSTVILFEKFPDDVIVTMAAAGDFFDLLVALPVNFLQTAEVV